MSEQPSKAWLVIQAKDSKYSDIEGKAYEYPQRIQYGRQIREGDVLVICLPKSNATDGKQIVGLGRIGKIVSQSADRLAAIYERYLKLARPAGFEEIGGDPRNNRTITMNPIDPSIVQKLLDREGVASLDALPLIASE